MTAFVVLDDTSLVEPQFREKCAVLTCCTRGARNVPSHKMLPFKEALKENPKYPFTIADRVREVP
jgi:hypothetical protein